MGRKLASQASFVVSSSVYAGDSMNSYGSVLILAYIHVVRIRAPVVDKEQCTP